MHTGGLLLDRPNGLLRRSEGLSLLWSEGLSHVPGVVVQQPRQRRSRPADPLAPLVSFPLESVHLRQAHDTPDLVGQGQAEPDAAALPLGPGDLLGDEREGLIPFITDQEGR